MRAVRALAIATALGVAGWALLITAGWAAFEAWERLP